ncbi:MAG: GTPase [Anaerolineae bacterium]|jgi:small GTP-binding protein|nr:GTPase [Anaerolineae bacterium]
MNPLKLPSHVNDLQTVLKGLDWHALEHEVSQEAQTRLVIVGPVNSGKSTLFNRLHGQRVSAVSAVPGTTKGVVEHPLGPFHLVDTPGFGEVWGTDRAVIAEAAAQEADLVLLLLDAAAGVRQNDRDLYAELQRFGHPIIVALNKADLVAKDLPWVLENAEKVLGLRPIPVSARTGKGITENLLPAILQAQPALAIAMARELPGVRAQIVTRIIRQAAWFNAAISIQPIPGLDIPILLASQTRMVLRIAAAYGESMRVSHARELLTAIAGSLLSRYLGMQLAKLVPVLGWGVSSIVSATSTYAIGETARRYFEAGGNVRVPDLRSLYQSWRKLSPWNLLRRKPRTGQVASETLFTDEVEIPGPGVSI